MADLQQRLRPQHNFIAAYNPFSNGIVVVVCREELKASRNLLSELQLRHMSWPTVIHLIMKMLNHSLSLKLSSKALSLLGVFIYMKPGDPMSLLLAANDDTEKFQAMTYWRLNNFLSMGTWRNLSTKAQATLHPLRQDPQAQLDRHNARTNF